MSQNVIDALVVTLGIDSGGFNSGLKNATQSLTGFATRIAGLAIGFEGLSAGIKYFENLHHQLADLEFTSRNLGLMGTELARLGELSKLFGGNMEDSLSSVESLQSAIFDLRFSGQMSESLAMLQRFGVPYLQANGRGRDPEAIARDAAKAIDRLGNSGALGPGERYQLALRFGLSGGLASAAAGGAQQFDANLSRARRDNAGLSEGTLNANANLSRDITSRRTQRDAQLSGALGAMIPGLERMNEMLQNLAGKAIPYLTKGIETLTDAILHPPQAVKDIAKAAEKIAKSVNKFYDSTLLPPTRPGEKAVSALNPGAGGYRLGEMLRERFDDWMGQFLGTPTPPLSMPGHSAPPSPTIPTPTSPRPPASSATPAASTTPGEPIAMNGGTTVNFQNVTINSRGQDGQTLARDFVDGARRRYMVSLSDGGLA